MIPMKTRIAPSGAVIAASLATVLLAACGKQEQVSEVEWAKAALARNPALEIISTDETAGTFSVRDTTTGATYKLQTQELMAAPLPSKLVSPATPAPAAAPAVETPAQPASPAESDVAAADQTTEAVAAVRGSGEQLAEGPGYSISRAHSQDAAPTNAMEGPGYSITREASTAQPVTPSAESVATEKRTDPIICQGDRLMHIDGETMEFTGDAVIAEKGCDLYISNARILAGGVGIIARQARVHIVNSTIGGSRGSYEVSDGAELYAARSTFSGIGRRFDTAEMNDLGGNEYLASH
jgi:hypothetical protein